MKAWLSHHLLTVSLAGSFLHQSAVDCACNLLSCHTDSSPWWKTNIFSTSKYFCTKLPSHIHHCCWGRTEYFWCCPSEWIWVSCSRLHWAISRQEWEFLEQEALARSSFRAVEPLPFLVARTSLWQQSQISRACCVMSVWPDNQSNGLVLWNLWKRLQLYVSNIFPEE